MNSSTCFALSWGLLGVSLAFWMSLCFLSAILKSFFKMFALQRKLLLDLTVIAIHSSSFEFVRQGRTWSRGLPIQRELHMTMNIQYRKFWVTHTCVENLRPKAHPLSPASLPLSSAKLQNTEIHWSPALALVQVLRWRRKIFLPFSPRKMLTMK